MEFCQLSIVIFLLLFNYHVGKSLQDISCYFGQNQDPTFPIDVRKQTYFFSNDAFCFKIYRNSTTIFKHLKKTPRTTLTYHWGAREIEPHMKFLDCNSTYEISYGLQHWSSYEYIYERFCFCCGDDCNDQSMDDTCNDTPIFTSTCYSEGFNVSISIFS